MTIPRRPTAILLTFCLLLVQAQVWASATLGCRHQAGLGVQATAPCHLHDAGPRGPTPRPAKLFDCHKCALQSLVAAAALAGPAPSVPTLDPSQRPTSRLVVHFYRFVPRLPERPPRT